MKGLNYNHRKGKTKAPKGKYKMSTITQQIENFKATSSDLDNVSDDYLHDYLNSADCTEEENQDLLEHLADKVTR